ncbi:MAG: phosphatidylglycerol lysyltransferase domain-containing protein [Hyphomonadaceae bacterium]
MSAAPPRPSLQEPAPPGAADWLGAVILWLAPHAFAVLAFASGAMLLITSAFPQFTDRMAVLAQAAPLLVIELSHFLASLIGLFLLVVAAGLWRKHEGAYLAALILLIIGAALALLRGLDYEEAVLLSVVAIGLYWCRAAFVRQSRLLREPLTLPWFLGIAATLAGFSWLGFFAYREVAYTDQLWWTFLRNDGVSRFMRAGVAVAAFAALIAAAQLLAPPRTPFRGKPRAEALKRARDILEAARLRRPDAWLALSGDKDFLFSHSGESFLMFRVRGRRWIAMGEPCGKPEERGELMWAFAERADAAGALPVFYALRSEGLAIIAEMGLVARKIGETALVRVQDFSLEGRARQNLRTTRNKMEREGASFDVAPPGALSGPVMEELKAISDAWLAKQGGGEKQFSMGRFDPAYLSAAPLALVRQGDRIVAFANIWRDAEGAEIAVDLMRSAPDAPAGAMDYLFLKLFEWARAQGIGAVDLGMAPLAGLERRRLAPALSQFGAAVYSEGERLYGFRGLRAYKAKFSPDWRPVFLAAPPSVMMALALLDVALLTSGGWRGLFGIASPPRRS